MQASDADSNSTLTYSLSGDVYPYGFFKVNTYSGLIQTARTLDTEIRSLVNLTIQATDGVYTVGGVGYVMGVWPVFIVWSSSVGDEVLGVWLGMGLGVLVT